MGCQSSKHASPDADKNRHSTIMASKDNSAEQQFADGANNRADGKPTSTENLLHALNPIVALQSIATTPAQFAQFAKKRTTRIVDKAHHLRNVFAVPLEADIMSMYNPPEFLKSKAEAEFLEQSLNHNVFFEHLGRQEKVPLVKAFEKHEVPNGDVIIEQGSVGDYFYIIYSGRVFFKVDGNVMGKQVGKGAAFGELALLYSCPRAATVTASEDTTLFRVDQQTFRYILQVQTERAVQRKHDLLKVVPFLTDLSSIELTKLANAMTPINFTVGQVMAKKGADADHFAVVEEGKLAITDIGDGSTLFEDLEIGPGGHYGEYVVVPGKKRAANIYALTDGRVFIIKQETFQLVLGNLDRAILRSLDKRLLRGIRIFRDTELDPPMYNSLIALIRDQDFKANDKVVEEGKEFPAALFIVRKGKLVLESKATNKKRELTTGDYFGDDAMLLDAHRQRNSPKDLPHATYKYTVHALEDCSVGFLTLEHCRRVFDTTRLAKGKRSFRDSIVSNNLQLKDFEKVTLLGAGTFGYVWLVSRTTSAGIRAAYAMKVQSKFELCKSSQAKSVIYEKNIMAQLKHPFLANLNIAYKDETFVYMIMDFVQGGELYSVMNTDKSDKLPESSACFYLAGIAEGLAYMHRRGFVYRDLKPENILINDKGYPIIVDFGFSKYVSSLTYTLCGTPLYLPPEVILNRGHNWAADHWSLGILGHEMITGKTPFYKSHMDQMDLFRSIVQCQWYMPRGFSKECVIFLEGLIEKKPAQRLGSLSGGEEDIISHPFFAKYESVKLRAMQIKAPFVPKVKDPLDASQFNDWTHLDDKMKKTFPPLTATQEKIFDAF